MKLLFRQRIADNLHRNNRLVFAGIELQGAAGGQVILPGSGRAVPGGIVHAEDVGGSTPHAGELQQEIGGGSLAVALDDQLLNLCGRCRRVDCPRPQTLVDPLLVVANPLPGGNFAVAAVALRVDVGIDAVSLETGDIAGNAGNFPFDEGRAAAVAGGNQAFIEAKPAVLKTKEAPQGVIGQGAVVEVGQQLAACQRRPAERAAPLRLQHGDIGIKGVFRPKPQDIAAVPCIDPAVAGSRDAEADHGHAPPDLSVVPIQGGAFGRHRRAAAQPYQGEVIVAVDRIILGMDGDLGTAAGCLAGGGGKKNSGAGGAVTKQMGRSQNSAAVIEQCAGTVIAVGRDTNNTVIPKPWRGPVAIKEIMG